ncbi:hypothetical protein DVS28_a0353 [Euzebya pacifica]|uniref:Uncharacterized protein n=1 Tax=Euzebya pacifica TaxID=1608957 RepID=A0A346XS63_9ACTN|nr:hypothetical protein DVS28_a0353 [Euzebya pacifica]
MKHGPTIAQLRQLPSNRFFSLGAAPPRPLVVMHSEEHSHNA